MQDSITLTCDGKISHEFQTALNAVAEFAALWQVQQNPTLLLQLTETIQHIKHHVYMMGSMPDVGVGKAATYVGMGLSVDYKPSYDTAGVTEAEKGVMETAAQLIAPGGLTEDQKNSLYMTMKSIKNYVMGYGQIPFLNYPDTEEGEQVTTYRIFYTDPEEPEKSGYCTSNTVADIGTLEQAKKDLQYRKSASGNPSHYSIHKIVFTEIKA